ncbi:hypothetical protein DRN86_05535 [Candidatus Geothermarchaeota archaeon]|nr:MAG: hypothetical protein DRN86_05535 [Candidatus Geothermarchaeota archaeon]
MRNLEAEINSLINDERLLGEQKRVLRLFMQELLATGLSAWRRRGLAFVLRDLAVFVGKPFEEVTKEDLVKFFAYLRGEKGFKETTLTFYAAAIKRFFKWLNRGSPPEAVKWIKTTLKNRKLPVESSSDLITREDLKKLIAVADDPRDKAIIAVLYESACRASEFLSLKVKDVVFDEYGAVLIVKGKTGMRRVRLIESARLLKEWINKHPARNNPNAPLWISARGKPLSHSSLLTIIKKLAGKAGLSKRVYPHLFRHSRLTELAKYLTEHELKVYAGWTQASRMAAVYVHLSGSDLDGKILRIYREGELTSIL